MPSADAASIVRRRTLSLLPTRRCNASCRNCGSFSGPAARDTLDIDDVRKVIAEAHALGFELVVFTGGEATLAPDLLDDGLRLARSLGLRTRLVTNGHWARTSEIALSEAERLAALGLDELNVSTGDEHARFVPLSSVCRAAAAGLRVFGTAVVTVELKATRSITRQTVLDALRSEGLNTDEMADLKVIESPWMPVSPFRTETYETGHAVDRGNLSMRSGCESILETYTVEPDGVVTSCCGLGANIIPELHVGQVSDPDALATAMERSEGDLLKLAIRYMGPEKILAWAASLDPYISWEGMYAHNCQACHRLYRDERVRYVISRHLKDIEANILAAVVFDEALYPTVIANAARVSKGI